MRVGRVAIKSVAATTKGTPAELGSKRIDQVRRRRIGLHGDGLAQRIVLTHQRHKPVVPQRFGVQFLDLRSERRKGNVDFSGSELFVKAGAIVGAHVQIDTGCLTPQVLDERRQELDVVKVDRRDLQRRPRRGRIEIGRQRQCPRNVCQRAADGAGKFDRPRGRFHGAVAAQEERIAEQVSQPVQGLAHRGLAQPDPFGRPRDIALGHERIEGNQQVEVDSPQIPFGYDMHITLSFLRRWLFRHHRTGPVGQGSSEMQTSPADRMSFAAAPGIEARSVAYVPSRVLRRKRLVVSCPQCTVVVRHYNQARYMPPMTRPSGVGGTATGASS